MTDSQGEPEQWWFNTKTGKAEFGRKTNSLNRIGPFDSEKDATDALKKLAERSAKWAEEDEKDA